MVTLIELTASDERKVSGKIAVPGGVDINPKISLFVNQIYVASVYGEQVARPADSGSTECHFKFFFPIRPGLKAVMPKVSRLSIKVELDGDVVECSIPSDSYYRGLAEDDGETLADLLKTRRVNRWGFLVTPFLSDPEKKANCLRQYKEARSLFNLFGVDLYVTGGNLLGYVRDGDFIPYDDDLDCSFCFKANSAEHAADQYTSFVSRLFPTALAAGFSIFDIYPGQFHLKSQRYSEHVDCLCGWVQPDGQWFRFTSFGGNRGISQMELTVRHLDGCEILIPTDAEKELEITYGKDWRVPHETYRHKVEKHPKDTLESFSRKLRPFQENLESKLPRLRKSIKSIHESLNWSNK